MRLKILLILLSFLFYSCYCEIEPWYEYKNGVLKFDNVTSGVFINVPKNEITVKKFTILNVGGSDVSIRRIVVEDNYRFSPSNSNYFDIDKTTCGNILSNGSSCDVYVKFQPYNDYESIASLYIQFGDYQNISLPLYGTTATQMLLPVTISGITPSQRSDFALAGGGRFIYLFGGRNFDIYDNSLYRLSDNGSWQYIPNVETTPNGRSGHTLTYIDNSSLYSIGGITYSGIENSMFMYNIDNKSWSKLADMLTPRVYHTSTYDNETKSIYVFGGSNGITNLDSIDKYDIETNTWSNLTPATVTKPAPRKLHSAVKIGGKIYIYGGVTDNNKTTSTLFSYDISANEWDNITITEPPLLPITRYGHSASAYKDLMYIVGGLVDNNSSYGSSKYDNSVYIYNTTSKFWSKLNTVLSISNDSSTINMGGNVYILKVNTPSNLFRFYGIDDIFEVE